MFTIDANHYKHLYNIFWVLEHWKIHLFLMLEWQLGSLQKCVLKIDFLEKFEDISLSFSNFQSLLCFNAYFPSGSSASVSCSLLWGQIMVATCAELLKWPVWHASVVQSSQLMYHAEHMTAVLGSFLKFLIANFLFTFLFPFHKAYYSTARFSELVFYPSLGSVFLNHFLNALLTFILCVLM